MALTGLGEGGMEASSLSVLSSMSQPHAAKLTRRKIQTDVSAARGEGGREGEREAGGEREGESESESERGRKGGREKREGGRERERDR